MHEATDNAAYVIWIQAVPVKTLPILCLHMHVDT